MPTKSNRRINNQRDYLDAVIKKCHELEYDREHEPGNDSAPLRAMHRDRRDRKGVQHVQPDGGRCQHVDGEYHRHGDNAGYED